MRGELEFRSVIVSSLFFAFFIGFISAIPYVSIPNVCCLWIIAGGFVSAFFAGRGKKTLETADGAIIGAIFGLAYAFFNEPAHYIIIAFLKVFGFSSESVGRGVFSDIFWAVVFFAVNVARSVVFGALGGLLYPLFFSPGGSSRVRDRSKLGKR